MRNTLQGSFYISAHHTPQHIHSSWGSDLMQLKVNFFNFLKNPKNETTLNKFMLSSLSLRSSLNVEIEIIFEKIYKSRSVSGKESRAFFDMIFCPLFG